MKNLITSLFLVVISLSSPGEELWKKIDANSAPQQLQLLHPEHFSVYRLDEATLKIELLNLSADPERGAIIGLPMPDGTMRDFRIWQTPMMPGDLADRYPEIKTFTAEAVNDLRVTAKLDFTLYGFHAMIYNGEQTAFIDPYDNYNDGYYMVHYKHDEIKPISERMKCVVHGIDENGPAGESMDIMQKGLPKLAFKTVNGYQLRTYRIAVSADNQFCQAATGTTSPTIAQALSKMTITLNRVNGIYERELSVTMVFVANENLLIWPTATGSANGADPFNSINSNPGSCLPQNQTTCDTRIGATNYDIGHVFTTGAGGLSLQGCVCSDGAKAQSVTGSTTPVGDGYDVDFVAHEIGHEFGGSHPFNNGNDGSCGGGNIEPTTAYEPGSGSTIMAYAGICPPDDIQAHSDAYFHGANLTEIRSYISTAGEVCAVKTPTGNKLVGYSPFTASYSIPYLTPFELAGPALIDSVADSATLYCWEQWDLGDVGQTFSNTHLSGPIFRSYVPTPSPVRVFPKISMVMAGTLSNAGIEGAEGEKVPDVSRTLHFKCTFRDIFHNKGCFTFPDDQITLSAINTGAGFAVTSQATTGISYAGHTTQTVTWNVVTTNVAPIGAANVEIYMTTDNGLTWPYHVGTFPNTGSASIMVPNPATTTTAARFKVKGSGNVFFNVNAKNFTVTHNSAFPTTAGVRESALLVGDCSVFPLPATHSVHILAGGDHLGKIFNALGQEVWKGAVLDEADISVETWPRGTYYLQLLGADNNKQVKRIVIE